ncbi:Transglycosylase SLT domain-containing protein [Carboxydocella sporoproducens DSM 16521]|uniref:Transglycosylase SLT domain-containing protein n=2 Tax=Carboxydocella TaxID=178898 RepID=A0A1T4QLB0_9FIRM|nr:Transglycosylase SLT domain-containing protein [Carboxydocella thermautotrophica]GAW28999.1 lytic murein transglycosylase [Carboxydocella sp. ULO1]SKA04492.1 Transglycosylase SLT domain-containing protein [Carboxydocella sporoproducens DSM 16521]
MNLWFKLRVEVIAVDIELLLFLWRWQILTSTFSQNQLPNSLNTDNTASFAEILQSAVAQAEQKAETTRQQVSGAIKAPAAFAPLIQQAAQKYGVDPDLITAVIQAESSFNPHAISRVGAQGLMQLMPATARALGVTNAFDPAQNIEGGTKYLRQLLDQFGGNEALAVAAYNAGPHAVKKYGNNIPPYQETQNYVKRVLSNKLELEA